MQNITTRRLLCNVASFHWKNTSYTEYSNSAGQKVTERQETTLRICVEFPYMNTVLIAAAQRRMAYRILRHSHTRTMVAVLSGLVKAGPRQSGLQQRQQQ